MYHNKQINYKMIKIIRMKIIMKKMKIIIQNNNNKKMQIIKNKMRQKIMRKNSKTIIKVMI